MKARPPALALAAALLASACTHVPITTMMRLSSLDMMSVDPAVLRVATRAPNTLAPRPGGIRLTVTTWCDGDTTQQRHALTLEEVTDPRETAALASFARTGSNVVAYRLPPAAVNEMRAIQAHHRQQTRCPASKPRGKIEVAADACRKTALPKGPVLTSTFIKVDISGGYMPLLEDIDLRQELGDSVLAERLPPCDATRVL